MEYEGRVQLGDDERAREAIVRIPDVEHPEWFGYLAEPVEVRGEITVTLLDDGLYNAWHGSAIVRLRPEHSILVGMHPLEPPAGA